jgi:Inovirus Coat protein B
MKKLIAAAATAFASAGVFAAEATPGMDVTPIVNALNGVSPSIVLVGGAVLAVTAVTFGYRTVRSFIGR